MIASQQDLLFPLLAVVALFALVIAAGLRLSRRAQDQGLRETDATAAWMELGGRPAGKAGLLYGVWEVAMHEVVLLVRDEHDTIAARITRGASGTLIEVGGTRFAIVAKSGWSERAELFAAADGIATGSRCRFEARGWGGNRTARYVVPGTGTLTLSGQWAWSRQRGPLPILQDGREVGCFGSLGSPALNRGRALVLPASIPLPVRLFLLWQGLGVQSRSLAR
ncbi:MAG TPA: hypothetical protein VGN24_01395 [Rhodanobacter sp.]|jgi:hypothetical protein|nr:hypothetical protein [Rhodanobacter sp.]